MLYGSDVRGGTGWKVGSCYHSDPTEQPSNTATNLPERSAGVRQRACEFYRAVAEENTVKQPTDYYDQPIEQNSDQAANDNPTERSAGVRPRALQSSNWWSEFCENIDPWYLLKRTRLMSGLNGDCLGRELRRVMCELMDKMMNII